jgi:hypothetical protein
LVHYIKSVILQHLTKIRKGMKGASLFFPMFILLFKDFSVVHIYKTNAISL